MHTHVQGQVIKGQLQDHSVKTSSRYCCRLENLGRCIYRKWRHNFQWNLRNRSFCACAV